MARILVIDDERSLRVTIAAFLEAAGHDVAQAEGYEQAEPLLYGQVFDTVISDIVMQGRTGLDVLNFVQQTQSDCPVVLVTGYPSLDTATEAIRRRAFDYIAKPVYKENLLEIVQRALEHCRRQREEKARISSMQERRSELEMRVEAQARDIQAAYQKLVQSEQVDMEALRKIIREEFAKNNRQLDHMVLPEYGLNLDQHISDIVRQALEMNDHNKTKTARYLGITRDVLRSHLKNLEA